MNIKKMAEVKGIGFPNKGAELLLIECIRKLNENKFSVALEPYSPYRYKVQYPLYTKTRISKLSLNLMYPFTKLPIFIRERLGLVNSKEISLVLDASGYAYGDPWRSSLANNRILSEKINCPMVMLPQSFGPFTNRGSIRTARNIAAKCELIFARENSGAQYFLEATGRDIPVIPDITFGLQVDKDPISRDVIVVPNFQVLRRDGNSYIELLKTVIAALILSGRKVAILNHEGERDHDVIVKIIDHLGHVASGVEYINPATGLDAKAAISNSRFVIASRYHALVSALSSGIPCMAIGWSFKYEEALNLFGIKNYDAGGQPGPLLEIVNSREYVEQFKSDSFLKNHLEVKLKVKSMWDQVFTLISSDRTT